ncbi:MAG: ABC transporter substrate-binding protein [Bacteroidota bacterium]|nr:ABC transporter substrate-binding protein [Bacteroidota bacterium]
MSDVKNEFNQYFILHFYIFVFVIIFSSCINREHESSEIKTVFRYNESAGITSLDPAFSKDQANIWAVNQIFNGLLQLDDNLNIKPCIAKKWDISPDGRIYTFHLRNDVFFQDHKLFKNGKGRRVVASDFLYSFRRLLDPKIASPGAWIFNNLNTSENKDDFNFKVLDDSTFLIKLKQPFPPFLGLLTMQYCSVVPREIVEYYGKDFRKNPVGTGPFKFKLWKEGNKLILVKNPDYFESENNKRLPYLDAITISFIVDKQTAFLLFVQGKLDFLSGLDASYKDELLTKTGDLNPKYKDRFNFQSIPYLNTEYLGILVDEKLPLVQHSPLKLKQIRQAINYGFDREKMMRYLRNNIGTAANSGFVPKGLPSFSSEIVNGYEYNPAKTKELLRSAGYPEGKGLPPITICTTSSYLDICEYIQHKLTEEGFNIKIEVNQAATLREMIAMSKINFFRGSWIADYPDAENYLLLFYSKNFSPKGPNYTHFSNPQYDKLYEQAQRELNDSLRYCLYRQMDKIIVDEAPVVFLYYDQVLRFTSKNI